MSAELQHIQPPTPDVSPMAKYAMDRVQWIANVDMEVDRVWHWLEEAIAHSFPDGVISHNKNDIKEMIFNNDAQLWTTPDGACVTCVTQYPQTTIVQIWLMGGNFESLMTKHSQAVYQWGRSIGASLVYVQGRKGWIRRLKGRGFVERQAITCMELSDGTSSTRRDT